MKRVIIGIIIVALAIGGYFAWTKSQTKSTAATQPTVALQAVKGPFRVTISSNGKVVSRQDVDIKCKASGTVIFLPFDVSDRVKQGDILLKLDTEDQKRNVKKAEAVLAASQAQLAQTKQELITAEMTIKTNRMKSEANLETARATAKEAKAKLNRQSELLKASLASQEDYDTAEKTAAVAEAAVLTAQAELDDIKTQEESLVTKRFAIKQQEAMIVQDEANLELQRQQLDYATVQSPLDGVVASLTSGKDSSGNTTTTRIGSLVQSGSSNVSGGTTVMTISDMSTIYSYATVDESDIGRVIDPQRSSDKQGQRVKISVDAFPNVDFWGKVVRVATKGVSTSNVVTFEVRIEVTSENKKLLKPEMTTTNEIIVLDKPEAVVVPQNCVMTRHGESWVSIIKPDGSKEKRNVEIGVTDGYQYEILSGLDGGEQLEALRSAGESKWRGGGQGGQNRPGGNRPMMMPR